MLSPNNRLQKDKDFKKVFRSAKSIYFGKLVLKSSKNNFQTSRFGFVVSNKIEKRATSRNSLKRKLRSIVRGEIDRIPKGDDIIVIVKENYIPPYDYDTICHDLVGALKKANLYHVE